MLLYFSCGLISGSISFDIVKNGIDKKLIEGCINAFEFRLREADTGGYPKGLVYYMNAMDSWLYGGV